MITDITCNIKMDVNHVLQVVYTFFNKLVEPYGGYIHTPSIYWLLFRKASLGFSHHDFQPLMGSLSVDTEVELEIKRDLPVS